MILALDTKIAPQKAIDFEHIKKNKNTFVKIFEACDRLGLVDIMKFQHDYDEEVRCNSMLLFILRRTMVQGIFGG